MLDRYSPAYSASRFASSAPRLGTTGWLFGGIEPIEQGFLDLESQVAAFAVVHDEETGVFLGYEHEERGEAADVAAVFREGSRRSRDPSGARGSSPGRRDAGSPAASCMALRELAPDRMRRSPARPVGEVNQEEPPHVLRGRDYR